MNKGDLERERLRNPLARVPELIMNSMDRLVECVEKPGGINDDMFRQGKIAGMSLKGMGVFKPQNETGPKEINNLFFLHFNSEAELREFIAKHRRTRKEIAAGRILDLAGGDVTVDPGEPALLAEKVDEDVQPAVDEAGV